MPGGLAYNTFIMVTLIWQLDSASAEVSGAFNQALSLQKNNSRSLLSTCLRMAGAQLQAA